MSTLKKIEMLGYQLEIDEEYEKCLEGLKELNEISEKAFGRKIYRKSCTCCDVESFFGTI